MPGSLLNTDFYVFPLFVNEFTRLATLVPTGVFWFKNLYGGTPATVYQGLPIDLPILTLSLYTWVKDVAVTLKVFLIASIVISGVSSYFYALMLMKKRESALISSIIYTFSSFYFNEIQLGHCHLIMGASLIPLVLLFWERLLSNPKLRNTIYFTASFTLLTLTELQITIFTSFYLVFRLTYFLLVKREYGYLKRITTHILTSVTLYLLIILPLLSPFLIFYPVERSWAEVKYYSTSPHTFFIRAPVNIAGFFPHFFYIGISVLFLITAFPFLLSIKRESFDNNKNNGVRLRSEFLFHAFVCTFFILYSSPKSSFISYLIYNFIPFASGIRVTARSSILCYLSTAVLCGLSLFLIDEHLSKANLQNTRMKNTGRKLILFLIIGIVFLDLTYGIEPSATPAFALTSAYDYVKHQPDDFRVVELPSIWGISHYVASHIDKHVIGAGTVMLAKYPNHARYIENMQYRFRNLPSKIFVENGGFEHNLTGWNLDYSDQNVTAQCTDSKSFHGNSSLAISVSHEGGFVRIHQNLTTKPRVTKDTYISFAVFSTSLDKASMNITLTLIDETLNETVDFVCQVGYMSNAWSKSQRNIYQDLGGLAVTNWFISKLEIYVRSDVLDENLNQTRLYVDDLAVYELSDVIVNSTLCGIKYILLHTDKSFYETWSPHLGSPIDPASIRFYFDLTGYFKEVYHDEDIYVYENLNFRGYVFAIKGKDLSNITLTDPNSIPSADADVYYKWKDINTMVLSVNARESSLIIISQNFHEGWRASDANQTFKIHKVFGVMGIPLQPGNYSITLHFRYYEESLLLFLAFYTPLLVILLFLLVKCRSGLFSKKLLKRFVMAPLSIYGPLLVGFSLFLCEKSYMFYSNDEFLSHGLSLSPFGKVLLWLGTAMVAGITLLSILTEARVAKVFSTQTITLLGAVAGLAIAYQLSLQERIWMHDILYLLIAAFITSFLLIFQSLYRPLTLRGSPRFFEVAEKAGSACKAFLSWLLLQTKVILKGLNMSTKMRARILHSMRHPMILKKMRGFSPNLPLKGLVISSISLMVLANVIQCFKMSILLYGYRHLVPLLANGAFYSFVTLVSLYLIQILFLKLRNKNHENSSNVNSYLAG